MDHVGGVPQLIAKMPVGTFIDHGPNREETNAPNYLVTTTKAARGFHASVLNRANSLPIKGLEAVVVSADGNLLISRCPAPDSRIHCQGVPKKELDQSENARSVGLVMTFGSLKIVDLGDLTWNKELELMCPNNKLGQSRIC